MGVGVAVSGLWFVLVWAGLWGWLWDGLSAGLGWLWGGFGLVWVLGVGFVVCDQGLCVGGLVFAGCDGGFCMSFVTWFVH